MDMFFSLLTPSEWAFAFVIGLVAGFIKGVVGFAMPLVLISGLTMFLSPELALAGLIFPTVITNMFQALRQGVAAAWDSIKMFKVFLIAGGIALSLSAQTVRFLAADTMLLVIGIPITLFALWQVTGRSFTLSHDRIGHAQARPNAGSGCHLRTRRGAIVVFALWIWRASRRNRALFCRHDLAVAHRYVAWQQSHG